MTTLKTFLFFTILVSFLLVFSQVPVVQAQVGINGASAAVMDTTFITRPVVGGKYGLFRHYTIDMPAAQNKLGTRTISILVDGFSKAHFTVFHPTAGMGDVTGKSTALPYAFGTFSVWRKNVNALFTVGGVYLKAGNGYIGAVTVAGGSWSVHTSSIWDVSDSPSGQAGKRFDNTFRNTFILPASAVYGQYGISDATRYLNFGYGAGTVDLSGARWMRIMSSGRCRIEINLV